MKLDQRSSRVFVCYYAYYYDENESKNEMKCKTIRPAYKSSESTAGNNVCFV